jgi:hypothetical protein
MGDWADTLGDSLRFVLTERRARKNEDMGMRESARRFAIEQEASKESRALAKAASDRLAAHDDRAAGEQFLGNLNAYEGALPDAAPDEMRALRGSLAADPSGFLRSAENYDLRDAALRKFGPKWSALREEERKAAIDKAAAGRTSSFDAGERIRVAQAQAALRALLEGAKTDVPASGMYPMEIGEDGKPITHGADDLAERRQRAALAAMTAILGTDLGGAAPARPAAPAAPRGGIAAPRGTHGAPPPMLGAPPAPRPAGPARPSGAGSTIKMRYKGAAGPGLNPGDVHDVPVTDIPQALVSGEWEHALVPGVAPQRR